MMVDAENAINSSILLVLFTPSQIHISERNILPQIISSAMGCTMQLLQRYSLGQQRENAFGCAGVKIFKRCRFPAIQPIAYSMYVMSQKN
jgi:hypothetical protein